MISSSKLLIEYNDYIAMKIDKIKIQGKHVYVLCFNIQHICMGYREEKDRITGECIYPTFPLLPWPITLTWRLNTMLSGER